MRISNLPLALSVAAAIVVMAPIAHSQAPSALPLVQAGNMRYLGSFRLPDNDGSGVVSGDLVYGGTALAMSPGGGLFVGGHDWTQRLCEVSIPAIGGTATIRQRCVDVTEGRLAQIDAGAEAKLGGTLTYNGRLVVSAFSYYDADGSQTLSHFVSGTTLATAGDVTGPVRVGTAGAGFVSGYMGLVPAEWRALLGGPALTGQCCLSIVSRTSSGPALSIFNPDDIGRINPVPATQVLGYPLAQPLANGATANAIYSNSDMLGGVGFPAGTRSVLFVGKHGQGTYCYGEAAACNDPASIYKGQHAYPYTHQVWAFDANDLVAVKNGTKQPSQIRPYAVWPLTGINNNGSASIAGATFDPATRRFYITEAYGGLPRVHVYEVTVGVAAPPPAAAEVCGDRIDNDGDGLIDEGCTVPGPAPAPTPLAPTPGATPEVCGDNVDNDRDGTTDEGCPGAPQWLTGEVRGSSVGLSWLAPIAGTVPTQYLIDVGVAPGQTGYTFNLGGQTSMSVSNVGTGRYYVRVRGINQAGSSISSNEVALSVGCAASPNPLTNLLTKVRGGLVATSWTDPDGCTDTSYRVSVADHAGGNSIAMIATASKGFTAVAGPGVYYLRAASVTSRGISTPSAEMQVVVTGGGCVAPQFATQLAAQVSGSSVQLSWGPTRVSDALAADTVVPIAYVLEVGSGPGLANLVSTVVGRTTSLQTPAPAGAYYVRVRPADVCGPGAPSNEVMVRVP